MEADPTRKNRVPMTVSILPDLKDDVGTIADLDNTSVSRLVENALFSLRHHHQGFQELKKTL